MSSAASASRSTTANHSRNTSTGSSTFNTAGSLNSDEVAVVQPQQHQPSKYAMIARHNNAAAARNGAAVAEKLQRLLDHNNDDGQTYSKVPSV